MLIERKKGALLLREKESDVLKTVCVVLLANCVPLTSSSMRLTVTAAFSRADDIETEHSILILL